MNDRAGFDPATAEDLFRAIVGEGERALGGPVAAVEAVADHLRMLARESLLTAEALAQGRIDAETAREVLEGRRFVLLQMKEFVALAGLQAARRAADGVFRLLGQAILARTGVNLVPNLIPSP